MGAARFVTLLGSAIGPFRHAAAQRHAGRGRNRARRIVGRGLYAGLSRPHFRARRQPSTPSSTRPRARAGASQGARRAPPQRPADRSAARHSGRHQGHLRHRRLQDRMRLAAAQGPPAGARLRRGGAAARGRRGDHRQDGDHRVRLFPPRRDPQSARSRAHARRLVVRLGSGGRRRHGAAGDRLADQRLGDPPGVVLRRLRRQADARHRSRVTAR